MFEAYSNGTKRNHKKGISKQKLQEKQLKAKMRQEAYNKLTTKEKLDKLDKGGYKAKKQRNKLSKEK